MRAVVLHPSDWPAITQLCLTFLAICLRSRLQIDFAWLRIG
jgi:hypothetical protein